MLQLNNGKYGKNLEKQLFSQTVQQEMWKPYTPISFKVVPDKRYKNHFVAYGLGWKVSDYCGYITLSHGGGLPGMLSQTTIIPELNLGIVVLTNTQPGGLSHITLTRAILDSYLGVEQKDWIASADRALKSTKNNVDSVRVTVWKTVEKSKTKQTNFNDYIGTYGDPWFGKVVIFEKEGKLWFQSLRSPKLTGQMFYYKATTFAVKWNYTDIPCNALATFNFGTEGKATAIKMKGISPNIDFSFDFHDLNLMRLD